MWFKYNGFDLLEFLQESQSWSRDTFGPPTMDSYKGILTHIEEEIEEVRKDPFDTEEWMDIVILGLDGAFRSGASPEKICQTLLKKLIKNQARQWPDWRTAEPGKPINHIK